LPRLESKEAAIERLAKRYVKREIEADLKKARKRAKSIVESTAFKPKLIDPPPEKTGLVRDLELRRVLREEINKRLQQLGIPRDADSFTKGDMARIKKECPLRMPSGVPIKRVVLLRTHNDPVIVARKAFDYQTLQKGIDPAPRSPRVYVGGNNHHIEIRENAKGKWTGKIIPAYLAAQRVRIHRQDAIDQSDCPDDGKFIMSLAQGDVVHMRLLDSKESGYFVVFKLDKPQKIQFKWHWDARRAMGEKDDEGNVIKDTQREEFPVSASQLKELAPPGEVTPIKMMVDALGRVRRLEPKPQQQNDIAALDSRIVAIARDAISLRNGSGAIQKDKRKSRRPGSWAWMHQRLRQEGLENLRPQLSSAIRLLKSRDK
jgi:hypothetical protein